MDANGANFLYRELAALVSFIACASFGLALALLSAKGNLEVVGTVLLLEYVVLMFATRNAGTRLVEMFWPLKLRRRARRSTLLSRNCGSRRH